MFNQETWRGMFDFLYLFSNFGFRPLSYNLCFLFDALCNCRYNLVKEVGDGTFGNVWRAVNKQTGEFVSCFFLKISRLLYYLCLIFRVLKFSMDRLQLKRWRKSITLGKNVLIWEKWRYCISSTTNVISLSSCMFTNHLFFKLVS